MSIIVLSSGLLVTLFSIRKFYSSGGKWPRPCDHFSVGFALLGWVWMVWLVRGQLLSIPAEDEDLWPTLGSFYATLFAVFLIGLAGLAREHFQGVTVTEGKRTGDPPIPD